MNYTEKTFFKDNRLNAIADRMYFFISENIPDIEDWETKLVLTGKVAAIMQDKLETAATNLVWITSDKEIYSYLLNNIDKIFNKTKILKFKERILLDFGFTKIEIWYRETDITPVMYLETKIYSQFYSQIPLILLS